MKYEEYIKIDNELSEKENAILDKIEPKLRKELLFIQLQIEKHKKNFDSLEDW